MNSSEPLTGNRKFAVCCRNTSKPLAGNRMKKLFLSHPQDPTELRRGPGDPYEHCTSQPILFRALHLYIQLKNFRVSRETIAASALHEKGPTTTAYSQISLACRRSHPRSKLYRCPEFSFIARRYVHHRGHYSR